jgi:hypothetical protein
LLRDGAGRWEFLADLFGIHLVPTVQVFLGMLPVYVAVTRPGDGLVWLSWVAFVVGIAAVSLELAADTQMHRFVAERPSGEVMDRGLWSWSRHPNYFGELGFWFSMALFGVAAAPADWLHPDGDVPHCVSLAGDPAPGDTPDAGWVFNGWLSPTSEFRQAPRCSRICSSRAVSSNSSRRSSSLTTSVSASTRSLANPTIWPTRAPASITPAPRE